MPVVARGLSDRFTGPGGGRREYLRPANRPHAACSTELDVLDRMRGPVFAEARTPAGFAKVAVDPETGTVVWPGGADLAPDTLYVRAQTGAWPNQDVAA